VRILHVIQELGPGGAERVVRQLAEAALARGDDVAIACAGDVSLPPRAERVAIPVVSRRPSRTLTAAWRVRRFAWRWRPDLIHAHNPAMAMVTALAARRGATWPALVTLHGVPPADDRRTARVLRWARLPVIACGGGVAAVLEENGVQPLATISNGVSPPPSAADRAALMAELGLAPGLHLVMAAGRLVPQKRHDVAVAAAALLPGTAWVIAGEGPLRQALEPQVEELGLRSRVRLIGARLDARALLGAAEVVVQPSDWEGLPLVALEAMRAGRPVVAAASRGLRELIRDGVDGLLVPPGQPRALADAVARLLGDTSLARRLGEAAASRVEREFSESAMIHAYSAAWDAVAAHGRRG
jgi:glycosyltransferase involved in cell wall biosynthesis